nr:MAG TPA: hypothetical protein [Caudoviricetes sp.]
MSLYVFPYSQLIQQMIVMVLVFPSSQLVNTFIMKMKNVFVGGFI